MQRRLLVVTGVLFALYPILRPYSSETGIAGADAFASPLWVASHTVAMIGFLTFVLAVGASNTTMLVGVGLVLPYYGAETFALNVLGEEALSTGNVGLVDLAEPIRFGPVQTVMFGVGLLLIAVAAVLVARRIGGWQAYVFAAGFVLFLPQFFLPSWMRIAHGVLVLVGCVALAARAPVRQAPVRQAPVNQASVIQDMSTTTGA